MENLLSPVWVSVPLNMRARAHLYSCRSQPIILRSYPNYQGKVLDDIKLSTAAAGRLIGRHAGTLRRWDREGRVVPRRNGRGFRVYPQKDVAALEAVAKTLDAGRPPKVRPS